MKRPDIVRRIAEVVHRIAPDAKTILYGSEARGDAQVDSDIDLLILLDGDNLAPERELEITRHLYEVEVETGVIISPMVVLRRVWERITTPFSINVMKEGVMKEKLDSESRAAIVNYRLERAYETLKEADYNTAGGYYNAAVNRLYYACYYAASALLLNCEIEANTHNGVKTQLSMHFVRTGHLSLDHGATFSLLFEKRQASDYSDFAYCDLALINTLRPRAEAFINAMEQLINKE
jgi:uncharacterized protein (UPF0332 family)/predicted nucleotidyltransferase